MAVEFRDLVGEVLRYATNAPTALAVDVLRESAREFFVKSHAWRRQTTFALVADQSTYNLVEAPEVGHEDETPLPYNTEAGEFYVDIVSWHEVIVNDQIIVPKRTAAELARRVPRVTTPLWGFWNPSNYEIAFIAAPSDAQDEFPVVANLSLTVRRTSTGIYSDEMVDLYKDYIVSGAVARLKMIPRMAWSDPSGAAFFFMRFEEGVREADNRAQSQHSRHVVRTTTYGGL